MGRFGLTDKSCRATACRFGRHKASLLAAFRESDGTTPEGDSYANPVTGCCGPCWPSVGEAWLLTVTSLDHDGDFIRAIAGVRFTDLVDECSRMVSQVVLRLSVVGACLDDNTISQ